MSAFVFGVDIFHQVGLVDDVHEMQNFGCAPEYFPDSESQFEVFLQPEKGEFPNIEMRALPVGAVEAIKRDEGKTASVLKLMVILRLGNKRDGVVFLAEVQGTVRK